MRFDQISAALLNSAGRLCTIPRNISIPIFYKISCSLPCKIALCKATPFGASFLSVPQAIQCPPCSLTRQCKRNLFPPPAVHTCTSPPTSSPSPLPLFLGPYKVPQLLAGASACVPHFPHLALIPGSENLSPPVLCNRPTMFHFRTSKLGVPYLFVC